MPVAAQQFLTINGNEVPVSNLDKVYWPGEGITKGDVMEYYIRVWPWLGPHLSGRPLSLVRYPHGIDGEYFYQKHFPDTPAWVGTIEIGSANRTINYVMANNLETLIWSVNLGCIEVHPWLSRYDNLDAPTYVIFDLDPMPPSGFAEAVQIAQAINTITENLNLRTYPKVSGATGIHIYLPIEPVYTYKQASNFVKRIGEIIIGAMPGLATNERSIEQRAGKVYIDHLQNIQGKTIASLYSIRPFPGAPVSMPCSWKELPSLNPGSYTYQTAPSKLAAVGDLFQDVLSFRQKLPEQLLS